MLDQAKRKMKREEFRRVADMPTFGDYLLERCSTIVRRSPRPATSARSMENTDAAARRVLS
ncbi:hypothetical protein FVF58_07865 [Paraburkholderia panacisoli]|uniref:Uncharacterized protein n=1 Tax=Paraburkholderia panacisoli TaxID=2603818 RepID=A0A5B0HF25_9BURK|nr:hypothetical protein [Paraburkholderia panacisoli]KAA1013650.1 hypothetical protein FVF58_07865 [Paraburkholderia panacisoli]